MSRPPSPAVTAHTPLGSGLSVWHTTTFGWGVSFWQVEEQPSPLLVLPSSHCSPVSTMPLPQTAPGVSFWQVEEQPSPLLVLPSSHCSPVSRRPLPQTGVGSVSFWQVAEQPSPLFVLPSSHCSPVSVLPLPQTGPGGLFLAGRGAAVAALGVAVVALLACLDDTVAADGRSGGVVAPAADEREAAEEDDERGPDGEQLVHEGLSEARGGSRGKEAIHTRVFAPWGEGLASVRRHDAPLHRSNAPLPQPRAGPPRGQPTSCNLNCATPSSSAPRARAGSTPCRARRRR